MKSIIGNINLSLLEIIAVLFPGSAALLLISRIETGKAFLYTLLPNPESEWQVALAFFGGAYFLGYVLFNLGSILDDLVYEKYKHLFQEKQILLDEKGNTIKDKCGNTKKMRPCAGEKPIILVSAIKIKEEIMGKEDPNGRDINVYKWTAGYLLANHPEMYAVVERHQTASKFFRSMVVVLLATFFVSIGALNFWVSFSYFVLLFLSVLIYIEQRVKAIRAAYEYLIVCHSTGNLK